MGRRITQRTEEKTTNYIYLFDTEIGVITNNKLTEFRALYSTFSAFAFEIHDEVLTPLRNHRGDTTTLINTNKEIVSTYRYDVFGNYINVGSQEAPWLFSGQRYDQEIQCYSFLKRDYDPQIGQWLTPDPLEFADGPNLYAYVHNNPLTYVDPYGLLAQDVKKSHEHYGANTKI